MAYTFADCYRTVRLHASVAPLFLAREWVQAAYKDLVARRSWSFLRAETVLSILAARTVTVGATAGGATVTSAAGFVATDVGRALRVGTGPTYTILTYVDASTITVTPAWLEDTTAAATATIADVYATLPANFGSFRVIPDRYTRRQLPFWITEDQLQILDPDRASSDTGPRCLAAASPSPVAATLGQIRYEYWPRPTSARSYQALYNQQADRLTDTETLTGVLADGGEVLIAGALARAAEWPGTPQIRSPYFNLDLARAKRAEFEAGVQRLALKDDAIAPDDLQSVDWARWPLADIAYNDAALRSSDARAGAW